jgi:DNA primase
MKKTGDFTAVDYVKSVERVEKDIDFGSIEPFEVVRPASYGFKKKKEVEQITYIDEKEIAEFLKYVPEYVIKRGLTIETATKFNLGYDREKRNVIIPIYDINQKLCGYSTRNVFRKGYYHSKGLRRSLLLYGENLLKGGVDKLILVEGFFDAMKIVQNGFNAVAVMGTEFTDMQKQKALKLCNKEIFIMMDGDLAGKSAAKRISEKLVGCGKKVNVIEIPEGYDPDELTKEELESVI